MKKQKPQLFWATQDKTTGRIGFVTEGRRWARYERHANERVVRVEVKVIQGR